jgi:hypothetical protein
MSMDTNMLQLSVAKVEILVGLEEEFVVGYSPVRDCLHG